ncbi:MAG: hypothetical protein M3437_12745 [Chloroflexota bacterium]|nr:hypothetical protein [Chloroflexota bacterium]MDQ5865631.1 hypothetical protein [Chloroflexota bacterium]
MPEAVRKHIAELLRREDVPLAREAARLFLQRADLGTPAAGGVRTESDEVQAILSDSFQRLASVVALSLQVDEPRLLSEELQWLAGSLAGRFPADSVPPVDLLSRSFTGACTRSLSYEECNLLEQWFSQARSAMVDVEPLLTEPRSRSQLESSTAEDN